MKLKQRIFNFYRKYVWLLSRIGKNVKSELTGCSADLAIITIAYNNVQLIEKQIELVRKYIKDENCMHLIIDNSPDKKIRKQIENKCERDTILYVGVPWYIDRLISHKLFGNGLSHGAALNWMFYHVLNAIRPVRFTLLDHDVFPLKECSLTDKLGGRDFYGVKRNMGVGWYLWPGWCIFKFDVIDNCKPDFLPVFVKNVYLDSGGGNFLRFYSHYSLKNADFPEVITKRVKKTEGLCSHNDIYHSDCIQYIDHSWLHIINGSNCAHIPGKEDFVAFIIDNLQRFYE